ncbi:MAG: hypothetical protein O2914_04975 [Bacteroidetes bacterium]|nr:hypothetical protein [Bacteroidota bacterium]MDA0938169.1 hypothetical protein [Bacteroidota bacterium]MDA1344491.1 hypothetical protein [Bacteroidota bacterium]
MSKSRFKYQLRCFFSLGLKLSQKTSTLVLLVFASFSFGQVETNSPPRLNFPNQAEEEQKEFVNPLPKSLLKDPFEKNELEIEKNNLNIEREKFEDPGQRYLSKLNNKLKSQEGESSKNPNQFKNDQYLGDFRIGSKVVRVIFRDHEYPDGDRVQILLNDKVVVANVLLQESFKGFNIELQEGFNRIDFVALNQGESGPNTAEVQVYNEAGELQAADRWNLATGVKATYVIIKE